MKKLFVLTLVCTFSYGSLALASSVQRESGYQNKVSYRGENRKRFTRFSIQKTNSIIKGQVQRKYIQRADVYRLNSLDKKEVENMLNQEQKERIKSYTKSQNARVLIQKRRKSKVGFRKSNRDAVMRTVLTKRSYEKSKQKNIMLRNKPKMYKVVLHGVRGKKVSLQMSFDGNFMARKKPQSVTLKRR